MGMPGWPLNRSQGEVCAVAHGEASLAPQACQADISVGSAGTERLGPGAFGRCGAGGSWAWVPHAECGVSLEAVRRTCTGT